MLNGCVTSPSSTVSMMSPSSANSSPQASSSFSQDRSPVSSPSRTNFPTVPLIKPSAIKDPAVHFPPSTLPSMCFPLHAIYAQNPYSGIVGSNLSTFFSPHAIARQMSFLGNSFSQNMSGKRIPAEEFSRFQPVFSPLSSSHRSANASSYPIAKQGCLFPFNSAHTASAANHLHNTQNMFNSLTNECLTSSPPFKRKMLNNSGDSEMTASTQNESSIQSTSIASNNWCRSPSQPLSCPLCSIPLEGIDINNHFYEEVHKVETLRKLNDWAYSSNESDINEHSQFESKCSSFHKKLPYSRWETFQRVKQNRHSRLTAIIRQTRKKFETEDLRNESGSSSLMRNERIWGIGSDISTTSQKNEDEDENDSSSEKNVDVVSDVADNEKESECEKSSEGCNSAQNRDSSEIAKSRNGVTDGEEIKPLENGLASESNIQNNSDIENIHETIDILRKRIRELENKENDSNNNDSTCYICSNPFTKPVVSVGCWHVHCEQCWISVVESQRLCPQCDTVVTSRDLRRVFLN